MNTLEAARPPLSQETLEELAGQLSKSLDVRQCPRDDRHVRVGVLVCLKAEQWQYRHSLYRVDEQARTAIASCRAYGEPCLFRVEFDDVHQVGRLYFGAPAERRPAMAKEYTGEPPAQSIDAAKWNDTLQKLDARKRIDMAIGELQKLRHELVESQEYETALRVRSIEDLLRLSEVYEG